jgi:putative peptide zinc metalloprotease protein
VREAGYDGEPYWLLKDPLALEYHRLHPAQYAIFKLLDGERSLEQLQAAYLREFPAQRIALHELQSLLADFHAQGLVISDRPGQAGVLLERAWQSGARRFWQTASNLLYIKLPGWDPERILARLYPWTQWLFRPTGVCAGVSLVVLAWILLLVEIAEFDRELPAVAQFFGWPNLGWLWLTLGVAKILHELGHGLSCRRMGGECHEIGMAFLMFSPCLYCDVSDSWMLPQKWRRIAVALAGMYIELMISAVAILVWWSTRPGLVHFLALQTFVVTTFTTVMLNANPLLQFDGYYILSDLIEVPNLRAKADRLLMQIIGRFTLGFEWPADPFMPQHGRIWFALYAISSAVYRITLLFSVTFVLYELLKPYGLSPLAILAAVGVVLRGGRNVVRMFSSPRTRPMSKFRTTVTLATLAAGLSAMLLVPVPYRMELPFVIEPHGIRHVYASTSGQLSTIAVRPGQHVEQGDVLFELTNFPQQDHLEQLKSIRKVQQVELSLHRKLNDAAGVQTAGELVARLTTQIQDYEEHLARLRVLAPCGGTIIAPPQRRTSAETGKPLAESGRPESRASELHWTGTPLESRNAGAWIDTGVHLLSIAPDDRREARVIIDQNQRNDVQIGCPVELKCDFEPDTTWAGSLVAIADRDVESIPDALSNKFGGPVATLSAADGRERLMSYAFEGVVELPDAAPQLLPGMQGRARFTLYRRTAAQWLWRYSKSTLHFRI